MIKKECDKSKNKIKSPPLPRLYEMLETNDCLNLKNWKNPVLQYIEKIFILSLLFFFRVELKNR